MKFVHVIAVLAIIQFMVFGILVGRARVRHGVKAPAVHGNEHFERAFRIQMNTLEQLVCFLPALFLAAQYWSSVFVSLAGVVYLAGRVAYWRSYTADPSTRSLGFALTVMPTVVLLLAALLGALFGTPVTA